MPIIRDAVAVADCVVVPVQPSPKDVLAQEAIGRVIDELRKSAQTILVLNRIDGRDGLVEQAAKALAPMAPNPLVRIKQRVAYKRADTEAQGGNRDRQGGGRGDRRPVEADRTRGEEDRWSSRST